MDCNINNILPVRIFDHAKLGLSKHVQFQDENYKHKSNIIEKAGNGLIYVVGLLPRSVKWVGRQFQDPRFVTIALTATALFLTTLAFYPAVGIAAFKTTITGIKLLLSQIPLWSVKFASYILTCATFAGYGARAAGRFYNTELMKAFYGLPADHPANPANMTIHEIREAVAKAKASEQE